MTQEQPNYGKTIAYKKEKGQPVYYANVNLKDNERDGQQWQSIEVSISWDYLEEQVKKQKEAGYKKFYLSCTKSSNAHIVVGDKPITETVEVEAKELTAQDLPF